MYEQASNDRQEAQLLAVTCGTPPDGLAQSTLRLLTDELVHLEVVAAISHQPMRQTLKKTTSSHT